MRAKCPNGCDSNFRVYVHIIGQAECEIGPSGEICEEIDTDYSLENPFDGDGWECLECGEAAEFVEDMPAPKKKKSKKSE